MGLASRDAFMIAMQVVSIKQDCHFNYNSHDMIRWVGNQCPAHHVNDETDLILGARHPCLQEPDKGDPGQRRPV
jgi:hypothetical protein